MASKIIKNAQNAIQEPPQRAIQKEVSKPRLLDADIDRLISERLRVIDSKYLTSDYNSINFGT